MLSVASKFVVGLACCCGHAAVIAQGFSAKPLEDEQLADVWGQALLTLTNTSVNDLDFTRITLAADIRLNANFGNIKLGMYNAGTDIDISTLNFGGAGSVANKTTVLVTDPYMEFVYRNVANATTREVVGMRLGFGGISGNLGIQFNTISGSLQMSMADGSTIDMTGNRVATSTACSSSASKCLSDVTGVTAGDSNGASRDFYISVLKSAVTFPGASASTSATTAQSGFWMNWRDRVAAATTK